MTGLVDPGAVGRRVGADDGSLPRPGAFARLLGLHVLLPAAVWFLLLAGTGYLLAHPLKHAISGEDALNRWFVAQRTPRGNEISKIATTVGNTGTVIVVMVSAAIVIWLISRRLREPVALIVGVTTQALVFLFTTLLISRPRPAVPKLDVSPPTSSFPSGHTGASTALYWGLVIICVTRLRSRVLKVVATIGFGLVPLAVLTSRLYRGMHHPTDVLFGLLNGLICALIAYVAFRKD